MEREILMNAKRVIDGVEVIEGREMLCGRPSLLPVIKGFAEVLGAEVMEQYLHEALGEEAEFYPGYIDIGLGESKGWARPQDQIKLINHIMKNLQVETGYHYKQWTGRYDHIICK